MACNNPHDSSTDAKTPCGKTQEDVTERCQPFIHNAVHRYEDRHQELDERERLLVNKTGIMERCIPALLAMKLSQTCEGKDPVSALDKVRELMKELLPQPDPADELVTQLEDQVDQLNKETAELHDKIIKADVELEEGKMELESLELVNCELDEQIKCMEAKMCVSLESINSDDRLCLAELRKLGENEKRMKKNIKQLEERETALRTQIERIFGGGCQKVCDSVQGRKHHAHRSRSHRKKDCQKLERTVEALFERDKARGKIHCGKLDKVAEKKNPMACKCQKKPKPCRRRTNSCERATPKCCRKRHSENPCGMDTTVQKTSAEAADSPWCTPELIAQQSCSSLPSKADPKNGPRESNAPCAVIVVKACECRDKSRERVVRETNQSSKIDKIVSTMSIARKSPWCTSVDCNCGEMPSFGQSVEICSEQLAFYKETCTVTQQKSKVD